MIYPAKFISTLFRSPFLILLKCGQTMVGNTPCNTAPRMLKTSPANQTIRKTRDRPSAEPRTKFSIICGEKTTTQQATDIDLLNESAIGSFRAAVEVWRK